MTSDLTDEEINNICQGRTQNAAMVRHLKKMGLIVRRKPNGRPLINRVHYDEVTGARVRHTGSSSTEPNWRTE